MDIQTLKRLEYHKILDRLAGFAASPLGSELALGLSPSTDPDRIRRWQAETTEGCELMRLYPTAEISGWQDVREEVSRAGRGAVLDPSELLAVGYSLAAMRRIKRFFDEHGERFPLLTETAQIPGEYSLLEQRLRVSITPSGEVADAASPALGTIRRRLDSAQARVKSRLEGYTRSQSYQKYLQDPIVTIRENRYVIPVKQEYRSQVPGIVHDQSASGATLFIEPMAVVEANNEVRRLQAAEKQEVMKILSDLSGEVGKGAGDLLAALDSLGMLDLIMARSRFSRSLDAWAPEIKTGVFLDIRQGRHPLLGAGVVPISVTLGLDFDTMVITGPNTGGKTVALKTMGLLVLMAQSGLHVPAGEGTALGVFGNVYADIGDEQSIEQSLSTFSSHMVNIVDILGRAAKDSLVLLDELGAGTDPDEGAALARAILEYLHGLGAKTAATTHYSELKSFALEIPRSENASVEFDSITLRPTFRLLTGRPGRSNAFEIAMRLGLIPELVARSRELMTADRAKESDLLDSLEKNLQEAERDRAEAGRLLEEARLVRQQYRKKEQELLEKKEAVLSKAREEAGALVREARLETREIISVLREKINCGSAREKEKAITEARRSLAEMDGKVRPVEKETFIAGDQPQEVNPGEVYYLPRFGQHGTVVDDPEGGKVNVQVGSVRLSVPLADLRCTGPVEKEESGVRLSGMLANKAREISTSVHLRGLTVDEALEEMEKYLDDACLAGLSRVYIVHGKGTGTLRSAVQRRLKEDSRVKSYRLGETGEGGFGVTVADLK